MRSTPIGISGNFTVVTSGGNPGSFSQGGQGAALAMKLNQQGNA